MPHAPDLDFDRAHIWHPYTSATAPLPVQAVRAARGCRLELCDGRELIDGMASWWCVIHGYNHPRLNAALRAQLDDMAHVMFGGLTHAPAVDLARRLVELTPAPLEHVFFADSGSVAVEVALKMAVQYRQARGETGRTRFLALRNGYHGDTLGAMSVCDPVTGMHTLFRGYLPEQVFAEAPRCAFGAAWDESYIRDFEARLAAHARELAAVILEPVVQGAGGMRFYSPHFLRRVRELCDEHDVLLIADEIATGFGRTGRLFACQWADIAPDILCLGKALTGGYLTLAAVLATREVAHTISARGGVFMHGPTFMANPLACAAANASLELLAEGGWRRDVPRLEAGLRRGLAPCAGLPGVAEVRVLGAIGVVEMREPVDPARAQALFVERGVWVRPFGRLVYVMPPYVMPDADLDRLTAAVAEVADRLGAEAGGR
ncbi:MAG: adenosylmethionine--8-amino-7-oxononanoate transaminase [Desulfovibrionaceae bacterium]